MAEREVLENAERQLDEYAASVTERYAAAIARELGMEAPITTEQATYLASLSDEEIDAAWARAVEKDPTLEDAAAGARIFSDWRKRRAV